MLYLVMEYIPGNPLSRALSLDGTEDPLRIVNILAQVGDALDVAHRAGVIHRDIKPDNILVEELPSGWELAKLLDFGLARRVKFGQSDALTRGKIVGAPAYMSPEQARAENVTPRSDVFSLGAVLMLLLTGRRIYAGATVRQVLRDAARGQTLDPFTLNPGLYQDPLLTALGELCRKATAPEPTQRYESAAALSRALRACVNETNSKDVQAFANRAEKLEITLLDSTQEKKKTDRPLSGSWNTVFEESWFEDAVRGKGRVVKFVSADRAAIASLKTDVQTSARLRGMFTITLERPQSACQAGEMLATAIDTVAEHTDTPVEAWSNTLNLTPSSASLLQRYHEAWHYEASIPILFEASDAGLVLAFRHMMAALGQTIPVALFMELPRDVDSGLRAVLNSLAMLRDTHPLLLVVVSAQELEGIAGPTFFLPSAAPTVPNAPDEAEDPPVLIEITREIRDAAASADLDQLDEWLVEVNSAVPVEYLGETAYRLYSTALRAAPQAILSKPYMRVCLLEAIRSSLRLELLEEARGWLKEFERLQPNDDEAVILVALQGTLARKGDKEYVAMQHFTELRKRLDETKFPRAVRLEAQIEHFELAARFSTSRSLRSRAAEELLAESEDLIASGETELRSIYLALEGFLLLLNRGEAIDVRKRAIGWRGRNAQARRSRPNRDCGATSARCLPVPRCRRDVRAGKLEVTLSARRGSPCESATPERSTTSTDCSLKSLSPSPTVSKRDARSIRRKRSANCSAGTTGWRALWEGSQSLRTMDSTSVVS